MWDGMVEEPGDVAISLLQFLPFSLAPTDFLGVIVSYLATRARGLSRRQTNAITGNFTPGYRGKWYFPWALPPSG